MKGSARARAQRNNEAAREQQDIDRIRREIGSDAFDGVVALAECRHEVAIANARVAARSTNSNHALAGLWVQALAFEDKGDTASLDEIEPEIIRWDRGVKDTQQFRQELDAGHRELIQIREEHSLPPSCSYPAAPQKSKPPMSGMPKSGMGSATGPSGISGMS